MAYFIAVETATKVCSAALFKDNQLLAFKEEGGDYSHAEKLALFVDEVLKEKGIAYNQLSAIGVSKGPGSYTGLRIGVSFAKGLCYALQIPLISVDTLLSMAIGARQEVEKEQFYLCPMIDARRMEVYSAVYTQDLDQLKDIAADVIEEDSYLSFLDQMETYFFGDGAEKCKQVIQHQNARFLEGGFVSARNMGGMLFDKYQKNEFENLAYFEPYYLKEFIALKGKKLV